MPQYDVRAIANEFWHRAKNDGVFISNMKLQKLPYLAYSWALVLLDEQLTRQKPCAWQYGPVFAELYQYLRKYGSGAVQSPIREFDNEPIVNDFGKEFKAELSPKETALIDSIWNVYGRHSAYALSGLTHQEGTPWSQTYRDGIGNGQVIDDDLIRAHYNELRNERQKS